MKGEQGPPLRLASTLALYLGPLVWFLQGPGSQPRWGGGLGSWGSGEASTIAGCSVAFSSGPRFQGDVGLGLPDLWFLKSRWKSGFSNEIS